MPLSLDEEVRRATMARILGLPPHDPRVDEAMRAMSHYPWRPEVRAGMLGGATVDVPSAYTAVGAPGMPLLQRLFALQSVNLLGGGGGGHMME